MLLIEYSHWFGTNFLSIRRLRNAGSGSKVSLCSIAAAVFLRFTLLLLMIHLLSLSLTDNYKTSITISCLAHVTFSVLLVS